MREKEEKWEKERKEIRGRLEDFEKRLEEMMVREEGKNEVRGGRGEMEE